MNEFFGVFRYEYTMSIRRLSLWLAFGILTIPYLTSLFTPTDLIGLIPNEQQVLSFAGTMAFMLNLFMPVVGGILVADRLVRDQKFGVDELLHSTALNRWAYLAGKYFGALISICTPVVICSLLMSISFVIAGAPITVIPAMMLAFLGINFPAYVFITAFSLACPLVMPVRVYQVLFTGYWFWGNYLSPSVMPTLNGTYLTANGEFVMLSFFQDFFGMGGPEHIVTHAPWEALLNLSLLVGLAWLAMFTASRVLAWREARG